MFILIFGVLVFSLIGVIVIFSDSLNERASKNNIDNIASANTMANVDYLLNAMDRVPTRYLSSNIKIILLNVALSEANGVVKKKPDDLQAQQKVGRINEKKALVNAGREPGATKRVASANDVMVTKRHCMEVSNALHKLCKNKKLSVDKYNTSQRALEKGLALIEVDSNINNGGENESMGRYLEAIEYYNKAVSILQRPAFSGEMRKDVEMLNNKISEISKLSVQEEAENVSSGVKKQWAEYESEEGKWTKKSSD